MSHLNLNGTYDDETCLSRLSISSAGTNDSVIGSPRCSVTWDGVMCWGSAVPGTTIYTSCPPAKGMDSSRRAYRICDSSGLWLNRHGVPDERGWTNYTPCFTPEILSLINRLYSGSESEAATKIEIARRTRILEIVGLSLSLTALLFSLLIFYYFRSLRNPRTRLHRHLFIAMVIQVAVRLTLYTDQFIVRSYSGQDPLPAGVEEGQNARGIDNTPILCEAAYVCLEYARTAMFMWMFVEGLYLHNMITVTVFEEKLSPAIYPIVGWVVPVPLTLTWAIVTAIHYGSATCWWGYNFTIYFWILEGPRLGVLMVNLAFLLNILRVLVTKLRQSNSSEAHQARKAVKAALVLLPLLGLTNLVNMLEAPLEKSSLEFGLWAYTAHSLNSCQGLILACLYCFWNGEVQLALKKFMRYKIFNSSKYRGGGGGVGRTANGRAGSVRMSLMNNSLGRNNHGERLSPAEPPRTEIFGGNEDDDAPNMPIITQTNFLRCDDPNNDIQVEIETARSSEVDSSTATSSKASPIKVSLTRTISKNKYSNASSAISAGGVSDNESTNNGSMKNNKKFKRFSRLRIWISPLVFSHKSSSRSNKKAEDQEGSMQTSERMDSVQNDTITDDGGGVKIEEPNKNIKVEEEKTAAGDLGEHETLNANESCCHLSLEMEENVVVHDDS